MHKGGYTLSEIEKEDIQKAKSVIENGGVILYPTDTIWGLGCDPSNEKAVLKIFDLKNRAADQSLIVLVDSERKLQHYTSTIPEVSYDIIDYAERPTTIIYEKGKNVAKKVLASDGSIGIRMCDSGFINSFLKRLNTGLTSTSANISGQKFDGLFSSIPQSIIDQVDYVMSSGRNQKNTKPSAIIKINQNSEVKIIRP